MEIDHFGGVIESYDHVSMAVWSIEDCSAMMQMMGGTFLDGGDNVRMQFRWVQFSLPGNSTLELIQPLEGNDWLVRHLERRGEGVHHLTFRVSNLEAAVARAEELEMKVTGYHRSPTWSEAFIHPKSAHGVVLQFAEWPQGKRWADSYESVMAGRVIDEG